MTTTTGADKKCCVHEAFFYRDNEEYLHAMRALAAGARRDGRPLLIGAPGEKIAALHAALGPTAPTPEIIDMTPVAANPGRIMPELLRFADAHPGRPVTIVGEPSWPGRSPAEYDACAEHEALVNLAFAERAVRLVCPYDAARLDERVLDDAYATHPVHHHGSVHRNGTAGVPAGRRYTPERILSRRSRPPRIPAGAVEHRVESGQDLAGLRRFVAEHAVRSGLPGDRVADLQLIATELVTNSLVHARSPAQVQLAREAQTLICAVSDSGTLTDPLAGRRPVADDQHGGRGLLLVHALADLVTTHTTARGTTHCAVLTLPSG